jgi:hypothetical protein
MRINRFSTVLIGLFAAWVGASAEDGQQPAEIPNPSPPGAVHSEPVSRGPSGIRSQRDPAEESAVFLWMEHLRNAEPEEFQRLRHLRQTQPEAFRAEIRRQVRKRGAERSAETRPAPQAMDDEKGPHPRRSPKGGIERDPQTDRMEAELLELARRYHATDQPEEKDVIRQKIRDRIEASFERRDAAWTARIEAARKDLETLERRLEQWRAIRGETIERRVRVILDENDQPCAPSSKEADTPRS